MSCGRSSRMAVHFKWKLTSTFGHSVRLPNVIRLPNVRGRTGPCAVASSRAWAYGWHLGIADDDLATPKTLVPSPVSGVRPVPWPG